MLVVSGTLLVLLTWAVCVVAVTTVGLLPALMTSPRRSAHGRPQSAAIVIRHAMWWGLLVVTIFAYLANLAWPLAGAQTAIAGITLVAALGIPGWLLWARLLPAPNWSYRPVSDRRSDRILVGNSLLWLALGASVVYLAIAALGPVTNYDTGLYHLGAIRYASEYATIPGLANLYFALGYGNAEFPLAALLGNGPWAADGFRLLNGFVIVLAIVDLALRWPGGQRARLGTIIVGRGTAVRRTSPGLFVLLVGLLVALVPLVALSDYWVTSPTQDSFAFVVTVVATAYLADAALGRRGWLADGATVGALGILLVLLRPTMIAFTVTAVLVIAVIAWRRRSAKRAQHPGRVLATVVTAGLLAAIAATARDVLLSGWLQFPLSVYAFDVDWQAADPAESRLATLGYHRNPADLWNSIEGWAWIGPWLASRVAQWETYLLAGLVVGAFVLAHLADRATRPRTRWRAMLLTLAPSAVASLVWFAATPPSYRFAWGPLFTLGTIPIGWSLWLLSTRQPSTAASRTFGQRFAPTTWQSMTALVVAVPVLLVMGYSALARLDVAAIAAERQWRLGLAIPYAVAPIAEVPVADVRTQSGLALLQPTQSDQCWANYPLCTPEPNPALRLRGTDLADGLMVAP